MTLDLSQQWQVFQDVQNMGDIVQVWNPAFRAEDTFFHCISGWQPIERLTHLQTLFSDTPYSGHELRQFNAAPWWYKTEFNLDEIKTEHALLRFEAIDYFARVYLNGALIGEHEGYFAPAEFEVGGKLIAGKNTLVVKVWSPFDDKLVSMKQFGMEIGPMFRFLASEKNMMKGTYDHADGFIQRDVNPVGIYGNVALSFYEDARLDGEPNIIAQLDQGKAELKASAPVFRPAEGTVSYSMAVLHPQTGEAIVTRSGSAKLPAGHSELTESFSLDSPLLWTLWDRGSANLYTLRICLNGMEVPIERKFGIRTVSMIRSSDTTAFIINGQRVFLRGTSYFPDVYLSQMTRERYESDLRRIKALGFNAVRVHVHVARPAFYELCDQLGLAVVQDSDISWFHSDTDDFISRAVGIFGDMVHMLRPHPSIICWVAMNEPDMWVVAEKRGWIKLDEKPVSMMGDRPGPQFIALLRELDPKRPYIKGSQFADDMESGDEHNYIGSISGEDSHYFDNYDKRFKLLTEFGMDMPGSAEKLRNIPKYYKRIAALYDSSDAFEKLKEYRRRYLKYMTEHCRIQKGAPCGGYFQFLFSDVCPQSFYGLQDWWGRLNHACRREYREENAGLDSRGAGKAASPIRRYTG